MPTLERYQTQRRKPLYADGDGIDTAIALGFRLVDASERFALAFSELGDIELPSEIVSAEDQATLRAIAPLYLACELESAGLLPAVELLSGLFANGGLRIELGSAAEKLAVFWRARRDRFTATERHAFFARLFGSEFGPGFAGESASNRAFPTLMIDLAEALYQSEEHPLWSAAAMPRGETRVRTAARQLWANLVPRGGGMTAFAARDLLTTLNESIQILKEPAVQAAFEARSVWQVVRNIHQRYERSAPPIEAHLTRGRSGQTVLVWLADVVPTVSDYSASVLSGEVIAAAAAWLEASLSLEERRAPASYEGAWK